MYVSIIQCLNFSGQESKTCYSGQEPKTRNLQLMILTHVTLKQGHVKKTQKTPRKVKNPGDPKEYYNHAKYKRSCFNGVQEKPTFQFFQMRK